MQPFTCGARNFRYIRSTLKYSNKLSKTARRAQTQASQVKYARTVSILAMTDRKCLNNTVQEVLNKNEVRAFSIPAYNLSAACSSILLLSCDGGATALTLAASSGDDDEVTTSAGKKRKHWITAHAGKG